MTDGKGRHCYAPASARRTRGSSGYPNDRVFRTLAILTVRAIAATASATPSGRFIWGRSDSQGNFKDLLQHSPDQKQSLTYCSSVDPWHEPSDLYVAPDRMESGDQPGLDLFYTSGITRGLPAVIPVAMLYGTPRRFRGADDLPDLRRPCRDDNLRKSSISMASRTKTGLCRSRWPGSERHSKWHGWHAV